MLPEKYSDERLMELACVAYAGIALADSGANLAPMQALELNGEILEQLDRPSRVNQTYREVKFRAAGALVPIHFTVITTSRMRAYLQVRKKLIERLDADDPQTLLVHCVYAVTGGVWLDRQPVGVKSLDGSFLTTLRNKVKAVGGKLPTINLRQLRLYKQGKVQLSDGVVVAAKVMGHSLSTAIRAYSKVHRRVRASEMGSFLDSLTATVIAERQPGERSTTTEIPAGSCAAHGRPSLRGAADQQPPLALPDCKKTEGCFFCAHYRIHVDEIDLRKLLSCRYVLRRLSRFQGSGSTADRIFTAVLDRIEALLAELRGRGSLNFQQIADDVDVAGNLGRYWAVKLQQLSLLGMLDAGEAQRQVNLSRNS